MPLWLGIELVSRLALTALFAALFAAASSPPHPPLHSRPASSRRPTLPLVVHGDLVALHPRPHMSPPASPPPPVAPLAATVIARQSAVTSVVLCVTVVERLYAQSVWLCLWARGVGLSTGAGLACKYNLD